MGRPFEVSVRVRSRLTLVEGRVTRLNADGVSVAVEFDDGSKEEAMRTLDLFVFPSDSYEILVNSNISVLFVLKELYYEARWQRWADSASNNSLLLCRKSPSQYPRLCRQWSQPPPARLRPPLYHLLCRTEYISMRCDRNC